MAWIHTIDITAATGRLAREYEAARRRAGRVFGIVRVMSLSPRVIASSIRLYRDLMYADSPLSRTQRELLATSVSAFNECHY